MLAASGEVTRCEEKAMGWAAPRTGETWEPAAFTGSPWEGPVSERNESLWSPCGFFFFEPM